MPTSTIHYERYDWLVALFGREKIEARYELLTSAYANFLEKASLQGKVQLNGVVLGYAVMDYFSDIARIKEFHKIELVNEIKICAYESYWLLRRMPLQLVEEEADSFFPNEQFVFLRIITTLTGACDMEADFFNKSVSRPFLESLMYFLKYRPITAQGLELTMQAFVSGANAKN